MKRAKWLFQQFVAETGWDTDTEIVILGDTTTNANRNRSIVNHAAAREIGFSSRLELYDWDTTVTFRQDPGYWDLFPTGCCGVPRNNPLFNWALNE